jgi:hypothetical protein
MLPGASDGGVAHPTLSFFLGEACLQFACDNDGGAPPLHRRERRRKARIRPPKSGAKTAQMRQHVCHLSAGAAGASDAPAPTTKTAVDERTEVPSGLGHLHQPAALRVRVRVRVRGRRLMMDVRVPGGADDAVGQLQLQACRGDAAELLALAALVGGGLEALDGFPDAVKAVLHHPPEAGDLLGGEAREARAAPDDGVVQEERGLALAVLALRLVQLLFQLVDALVQEALHVHHLLALVQLRHGLEAGQHPRRLGHVWPHLRLRLLLAVHHHARVHVAQRRQLARLLHQPLAPLLEGGAPGRVVSDPLQGHLLASHARRRRLP